MITEKDLKEAIEECKAKENPNSNTCIMLAAFLTIQKELFGHEDEYSFASGEQVETIIDYYSDTDFGKMICGRNALDIWPIMDDAMQAVQTLHPKLYRCIKRKIEY